MKTVVALTAAIAILATPALAAQKVRPNMPLPQAVPKPTLTTKTAGTNAKDKAQGGLFGAVIGGILLQGAVR